MHYDIIVETLVVEEDRPAHIAKHKVKIEQVLEIISGDYVYIQGRIDRWLLIGKTKKGKFLTIVVGKRRQKNTYGLVTARPASNEERNFYNELTLQGGEDGG